MSEGPLIAPDERPEVMVIMQYPNRARRVLKLRLESLNIGLMDDSIEITGYKIGDRTIIENPSIVLGDDDE